MRPTPALVALNAAVLAAALLVAVDRAPALERVAAVPSQDAPVDAPPLRGTPAATPSPTAAVPAPAAPPPSPAPAPAAPPTPAVAARPPAPVERVVMRTGWGPYATVGPVTLHFPGDVVEVVGLHQSGNDGAQPQSPVPGLRRVGLLGSRGRDTDPQGSADVVVDPRREVRSPVTGTVLRAGTYRLYCDHVDDYVVIEPEARPGWEVKVLHFEGLAVREGDRVRAGRTVVGSRARVLPFASQVDRHTVAPHWPHLHIEVVDPAVPDRRSGRTCD